MNVFDLFAKLSLDSSDYEKGLDTAETQGKNFGKGLASAAKVGVTAVAAVGTAAVAAGTELVKATGEVAEYGDNIDKMSQKIGISAEAYQEWDAVLQHCGASVDSLQPAMKTLSTQAQQGNEAFQKLGISVDEVANLSQEELFAKVVAGLQNMEEGTERTYIASQLLGRGATELGALFNTSAEDTQAMIDRVHELGGVMSNDAVKSAAAYQDQLQDMQTAFDGIKRNLIGEFMPAITDVMGGLTDIFAGDYDEGLDKISEGISNLVEKLTDIIPKALEIGVGIIEALSTSIIENVPAMMPALTQLVMDTASMIIEQLPMLATAAISIIQQLAAGISDALPQLIPTVVDVVLEVVEVLIDNADELVDSAVAIIMALANGLIDALPRLLDKAPIIIAKLVNAIIVTSEQLTAAAIQLIATLALGLIQALPDLLSVAPILIADFVDVFLNDGLPKIMDCGFQLIEGLWEGIKDAIPNLLSKIPSLMMKIVNKVKSVFGIHSPSKVFAGIGENLALGLDQGWEDEIGNVTDNIDASVQSAIPTSINIPAVSAAGAGSLAGVGGDIVIPVYIGQSRIDEIVVTANQIANYRNGGR